ncbi:MAG: SprT-like domain-containing protein [Acidobacteria bacterium]|nr:SprT-like domain-containing protein [Acidobacteriota bacterium]
MPTTATTATDPTRQQYNNLQRAFDLFNAELFGGTLRPVLITLQRKAGSNGYFWSDQFKRRGAAEGPASLDEIALNPDEFHRTDEEILSTLAHEMAHLWQQQHGKPGRGRYHNRQWAEKMREIGLQPTDTGAPGGKETGDHMTHLIVAGGLFAGVCARLLESGQAIDWQADTLPALPGTRTTTRTAGQQGSEDDDEEAQAPAKKQTRAKFTCPLCSLNAWAKPDANLACADCSDVDAGELVIMAAL